MLSNRRRRNDLARLSYVVVTPSGPATCATWVQLRGGKPDGQMVMVGCVPDFAAGSRHDVLGAFRLRSP